MQTIDHLEEDQLLIHSLLHAMEQQHTDQPGFEDATSFLECVKTKEAFIVLARHIVDQSVSRIDTIQQLNPDADRMNVNHVDYCLKLLVKAAQATGVTPNQIRDLYFRHAT